MADRPDPFAELDTLTAPPAAAPADRPDPFASVLPLPPPPPPPAAPDTRPFLTRANETAGDAIRAFTNAVTLGQMDRIAGGMNYLTGMGGPSNLSDLVKGQHAPQSYDEGVNQQVKLSDEAAARSPAATIGGSLAGAVALPGFGGEALAARLGGGALARGVGYGTAGAGMGAAAGAGNTYSGEAADYAKNAMMGGVLGGLTGGVLGSVAGPRPRVTAAETPTTPEIYSWADKGYDKLRQNYHDIYEAPHVADRADQAESYIFNRGYRPARSPGSWDAVDELRAAGSNPSGYTSPAEIERARQVLTQIPKGPESAADRSSGQIVRNAIDDFYRNPPQGAVRVGAEPHAAEAAATADYSRALWGGARRAETFDNILHDATLASNNPRSGVSYPEAVWSGVRNLEKSDRPGAMPKLAGYSDAEKAALEKIAYPGFGQRALAGAGNWLGGGSHGIVNPITLAAGGAGTGAAAYSYLGLDPKTGAMLGGAAPLTGWGARIGANRIANQAIKDASEIIHQSNPLYQNRVLMSGTKPGGGLPAPVNDAARNAITDALVRLRITPLTAEEQQ